MRVRLPFDLAGLWCLPSFGRSSSRAIGLSRLNSEASPCRESKAFYAGLTIRFETGLGIEKWTRQLKS